MKVGIVCCGKLENRYAVEFVEHYKKLGFDHIFIADNNNSDGERFIDVLQSYVDEGFVSIHYYIEVQYIQRFVYIELYRMISEKFNYDWLFFIDFDEYLILKEDKNIKDYLARDCFKNYNQILINWRIYSDNNLIYDDGRPCIERFTKETVGNEEKYGRDENACTKPFLRTGLESIAQENWHYFFDKHHILDDTTCNNNGDKCECDGTIEINYDLAYIKHFMTKTIDEYVNNKCVRGCGDMTIWEFRKHYGIKRFFIYNEVTPEKLEYLKNKGITI